MLWSSGRVSGRNWQVRGSTHTMSICKQFVNYCVLTVHPERSTSLIDCNFIIRLLDRDVYWLTFISFICMFYTVMLHVRSVTFLIKKWMNEWKSGQLSLLPQRDRDWVAYLASATGWRPGVVVWLTGTASKSASCTAGPVSASAGNGRPHNALRYTDSSCQSAATCETVKALLHGGYQSGVGTDVSSATARGPGG